MQKELILERMHNTELVLPSSNFAVEPNNPERFIENVGFILPYFRDTELLVDKYSTDLNVLLGPDPFRDRWKAEEVPHGQTIDAMLLHAGMETKLPEIPETSLTFRALGSFVQRSKKFERIMNMVVATHGYINEATNMMGQRIIISKLKGIGEDDLARTFGSMRAQERNHRDYYRLTIDELAQTMTEGERVVADAMFVHNFTPVGANSAESSRRFGQVMVAISGSPEVEGGDGMLLDSISELAYSVLNRPTKSKQKTLKHEAQITKAFIDCRDEYLAAA